MVKQKIFSSSALAICMGLGLLCAFPSMADGDPNEPIPELLVDEKEETSEEAVATITAEGDFLLPTYLLPVEGEAASNEMIEVKETKTTTTTTTTKEQPITLTTTTTTKTTTQELPVVLTSESGSIQPVDPNADINIDINTDALVIPSIASAGSTTTARDVKQLGTGHASTTVTTTNSTQTALAQSKPILIPLAPLPEAAEVEPSVDKRVRHVIPSEYADQFLSATEQGVRPAFIMPQEIKVSFYKNATDFSGQTLKWIKAFAKGVLADPRLMVEVRVSAQDPVIQYKRLILVRNALVGTGLSPHQIRMVQSNRSPDSLVLRQVPKPELMEVTVTKTSTGKKVENKTVAW